MAYLYNTLYCHRNHQRFVLLNFLIVTVLILHSRAYPCSIICCLHIS